MTFRSIFIALSAKKLRKKIRDFLLKIDVNTRHFEISLQTTVQNILLSIYLSQTKNCPLV